jgi:3beta-hydroxy-delta5-steroid dehydrogenase/steroid delta-isomerase
MSSDNVANVANEARPPLGICLVTGAAGLVGSNLVASLLAKGYTVRALVHRTSLVMEHPQLSFFKGSIEDGASMREACSGVDTVFHTAAAIALLGGKHASSAYRAAAWKVNVQGTDNVIQACFANGVSRLVYTSSVDVCFDGTSSPDMDQTTPYAAEPASVYQETKIEAEKRVLAANGVDGLSTCALRADGIYGPESNMILDAVVEQVALGRFKAGIGSADTLQDNSYVGNLVHGEILAAEHLGPGGTANGKAYFINDYMPQNTLEFLRPVVESLGEKMPTMRIPRGLMRPILTLWQYLHFRLGFPEPLLAPHELDKITVTHYGSIKDAERDFGYQPIVPYRQAIELCLPYCQKIYQQVKARQ